MKIYIAGPMRDTEKNKYIHLNFDEFDRIERMLRGIGHTVISPAAIDRLFEGWDKYAPEGWQPTREDTVRILQRDLNALQGCEAIYLMEGWEDSSGVCLELAWAKNLGLQVIYQVRPTKMKGH